MSNIFLEIKHYRGFKLYGQAVNFCVKYNLPLFDIKIKNDDFKYSIEITSEILEKDWAARKIPCVYIDRRGRVHEQ